MNLGSIMASLEDKGCQSLLNQGVKFVKLNSLGSVQQIFTRFLEFLLIKVFFLSVLKRMVPLNNIFQFQVLKVYSNMFIKQDPQDIFKTSNLS